MSRRRVQNQFSLDVARVLKAYFPELGTRREMEGADTIDALGNIYSLAKRGSVLKDAPPADPAAKRLATPKALR